MFIPTTMVVVSEVKPVWYLLGTIGRNKDPSWTQAEKDSNSDHPEFIKYILLMKFKFLFFITMEYCIISTYKCRKSLSM